MNEFEWLTGLVEDPVPNRDWVSETRHRLTDSGLLRRFVVDPMPRPDEAARALSRLRQHIEASSAKTPKRWMPAAAAMLVGVVVVGFVGLLPAAASGLLDVATATELLPPEEFSGAQVIRIVEEEILVIEQLAVDSEAAVRVVYVLPRVQIRRQAADGSLQIETTPGIPVFMATADEAAWRDEIEGRIRPGIARIETFAAPDELGSGVGLLTADADLLAGMLAADVAAHGDPAVPDSIEIMERVANIYRSQLVRPAERAALLRVLAQLDGVREAAGESAGGAGATLVHSGRGTLERFTLQFDAAGWLVFEEVLLLDGIPEIGVPAGVAMQRSHYQPPFRVNPTE